MPEPANGDTRVSVAVVSAEFRSCKEASAQRHAETNRRLDVIQEDLKGLREAVQAALLANASVAAGNRAGSRWADRVVNLLVGLLGVLGGLFAAYIRRGH